MIEDVKELLDDYYGNSRNDDDKQAIAEFVRNYGNELLEILDSYGYR